MTSATSFMCLTCVYNWLGLFIFPLIWMYFYLVYNMLFVFVNIKHLMVPLPIQRLFSLSCNYVTIKTFVINTIDHQNKWQLRTKCQGWLITAKWMNNISFRTALEGVSHVIREMLSDKARGSTPWGDAFPRDDIICRLQQPHCHKM